MADEIAEVMAYELALPCTDTQDRQTITMLTPPPSILCPKQT